MRLNRFKIVIKCRDLDDGHEGARCSERDSELVDTIVDFGGMKRN